jgi:hypothetical protein
MPSLAETLTLTEFLPQWLSLTLVSISFAWTLCVFGVVFGKAGRSPIWGLVFLLSGAGLVALAWLAWARWPVRNPAAANGVAGEAAQPLGLDRARG